MTTWITIVLVFFGTLVTLLAAVGLLRFPDLFTRMHAASKPASLGLILFAIAAAIQIGGVAGTVKAVFVIAFIFLKVPVSAQALGRAAEITKAEVFEGTVLPDQPESGERKSVLANLPESGDNQTEDREPMTT